MARQLILYIAMSIDGFIAKDEDNIDFLSIVEVPGEDYGYMEFQEEIDTVIWGRKTYDKILTLDVDFTHPDKKCYVLSKTKSGSNEHVTFYNGEIKDLIITLKQQQGKNIYCDGGGEIVFELLKHALIDKMIISIVPHLVGSGVRLFKDNRPEQNLKLTNCLTFKSGLVQLWYDNL